MPSRPGRRKGLGPVASTRLPPPARPAILGVMIERDDYDDREPPPWWLPSGETVLKAFVLAGVSFATLVIGFMLLAWR
jgi:hypothetical protein